MKKLKTALPIGIFLLTLFVSPLLAIEYGGIGGRPAYPDPDNERTESIFIFETAPGETEEDGVTVVNSTDEEKTILVYATDTTPSSGGGFACKQYSEEVVAEGTWFELEKNELTLEPGTNEIVPFTLTVPEGVDVGEHDACIVIQEKPSGESEAGVNLSLRAAMRAMILIPGDVVKKLNLESLTYFQTENDKNLLKLVLINSGNVSIDADIKITTTPIWGGKPFAVNEGIYTILHNNTQELNFEIDKNPWGGIYRVVAEITYEGEDGTETLGEEFVFFIPPTKYAIGVYAEVLILIILVIYLLTIVKRKKNKPEKGETEKYTVQKGDTWKSLSKERDIKVKELVKLNKRKDTDAIIAGEEITVPVLLEEKKEKKKKAKKKEDSKK
jgi:LysM repeat protein